MAEWVSVADRLPEPETEVLARCRYKDAWHILACYVSKRWYDQWYTIVAGQWVKVTHWMPLPEPPKEGE